MPSEYDENYASVTGNSVIITFKSYLDTRL